VINKCLLKERAASKYFTQMLEITAGETSLTLGENNIKLKCQLYVPYF
jgi:hypothetical protein